MEKTRKIKKKFKKNYFDITYHINSDIVAKALVAGQQVTENNGAPLWSVPGLYQYPGVDLQRAKVLLVIGQTDVVHVQLTQGIVVIVLPQFKFVQCNKHPTLVFAAKQLATLVRALREALTPTFLLELEKKKRRRSRHWYCST